MTEMSCKSCSQSVDWAGALWCVRLGIPAAARCHLFSYEPGTDEAEQLERAVETARQEGLVR